MLSFRCGVQWKALLATVLAACVLGPLANAQEADRPKEVLVLNSTRQNEQFYIVLEREMPKLLAEGLGGVVDVYAEYFDFARFPRPDDERAYVDFLRQKYEGRHFDLLLLMGDVAMDFMSRHRDVLFSGTPLVFYSVNPPRSRIAIRRG